VRLLISGSNGCRRVHFIRRVVLRNSRPISIREETVAEADVIEFIAWFIVLVALLRMLEGWARAILVGLYVLGSVVVFLA
jgi:hypothetical protein